eukprot:scaffold59586_cov60-Phaeocystis_antarctica.AAC.1
MVFSLSTNVSLRSAPETAHIFCFVEPPLPRTNAASSFSNGTTSRCSSLRALICSPSLSPPSLSSRRGERERERERECERDRGERERVMGSSRRASERARAGAAPKFGASRGLKRLFFLFQKWLRAQRAGRVAPRRGGAKRRAAALGAAQRPKAPPQAAERRVAHEA